MAEHYLFGVDIGTQGTKAALFRASDGRQVASAFRECRLIQPRPGWVEQDPDEFYQSAISTMRECVEAARSREGLEVGSVAGIGIDGQMAGIMGIGPDFDNVTPYDSWLDTRCEPYIAVAEKAAGTAIVRICGCPASYNHGPKMLWWKAEHPDVFARVCRFVVPGGYVAGRLCGLRGEDAFMDSTYLHFTGVADTRAGRWSDELLGALDLPLAKMPRIVRPSEVVGGLSGEAAAAIGLVQGTPVVAGCGDTAAGFLGSGVVTPGDGIDVAGTAAVFAVASRAFVTDEASRTIICSNSPVPGLWYLYAYTNGSGMCLKWWRDKMVGRPGFGAGPGAAAGATSYADLDRMAEAVPPGSEGLIFVPHFAGVVCPARPNVRGAFVGISWPHGQAHFYRAILESTAYEYWRYARRVMEMTSAGLNEIRCVGGGAASDVWCQIKSDVLGVPWARLDRSEFSVLGSAVVAGHGVGLYPDVAAASSQFVRTTQRFLPRLADVYRPLADRYLACIDNLLPAFDGMVQATSREAGATGGGGSE